MGDEALVARIVETRGGCIDFDRAVATPDFMKALTPAGKVLGPRGLMPNPKVRPSSALHHRIAQHRVVKHKVYPWAIRTAARRT